MWLFSSVFTMGSFPTKCGVPPAGGLRCSPPSPLYRLEVPVKPFPVEEAAGGWSSIAIIDPRAEQSQAFGKEATAES